MLLISTRTGRRKLLPGLCRKTASCCDGHRPPVPALSLLSGGRATGRPDHQITRSPRSPRSRRRAHLACVHVLGVAEHALAVDQHRAGQADPAPLAAGVGDLGGVKGPANQEGTHKEQNGWFGRCEAWRCAGLLGGVKSTWKPGRQREHSRSPEMLSALTVMPLQACHSCHGQGAPENVHVFAHAVFVGALTPAARSQRSCRSWSGHA